MTAAFRNGALTTHKMKYLCDREKSRLPELQERARLYTTIEESSKKLRAECDARINKMREHPIIEEDDSLRNEHREIRMKIDKLLYSSSWTNYPELYRHYSNGFSLLNDRNLSKEDRLEEIRNTLPDEKAKKLFDAMIDLRAKLTVAKAAEQAFERENREELQNIRGTLNREAEYYYIVERVTEHVRDNYGKAYPYVHDEIDPPQLTELVERLGYGCINIGGVEDGKPRIVVHCGCPVEGCRGFVGEGWSCGLCGVSVCQTCRDSAAASVAASVAEHVCQKEKVETAALLAKETKACPQCAALIYKIDGCDQMWCTQCHTTFSWRTGQKEEGRVHNPHYYEWMRRTQGSVPREPGDGGGCAEDGLREFNVGMWINQAAGRPFYSKQALFADVDPVWAVEAAERLEGIHRLLSEIHDYDCNAELRREIDHDLTLHLENAAVQHLANELTEEQWQAEIFYRESHHAYSVAKFQIYEMFFNAGRDIFNSISAEVPVGSSLKQIVELVAFTNEEFRKLLKRFDRKVLVNWIGMFGDPLEFKHGLNLNIFKKEKSDRWYRAYVDAMLLKA